MQRKLFELVQGGGGLCLAGGHLTSLMDLFQR